jgi:DNA-binding SARP family transcriptional activator
VRLALMGSFTLGDPGRPLRLPMSAQRLLAYLALARKPVSRLYAAGHLWPEASDVRAAASLRSALWRARQAGDIVRADAYDLCLDPSVDVDVTAALALARRVEDTSTALGVADVAALCRTDDLLPGWYDEPWLDIERDCFRMLRVHALERLAERLAGEGRLAEALEAGITAVSADPLRETAHRALIRVHLAEGNTAEAVRQFHAWERLSESSLGLGPSPQMRELVGAV